MYPIFFEENYGIVLTIPAFFPYTVCFLYDVVVSVQYRQVEGPSYVYLGDSTVPMLVLCSLSLNRLIIRHERKSNWKSFRITCNFINFPANNNNTGNHISN